MTLGFYSACNRNEYLEYFLVGKGGQCLGLTTLPPSCADYLEIWEPQPPGTLRYNGIALFFQQSLVVMICIIKFQQISKAQTQNL